MTLSQDFDKNQGFDCSAYLRHGLQWPVSKYLCKSDGFLESSDKGLNVGGQFTQEVVSYPLGDSKQMAYTEINKGPHEKSAGFRNEHYYENEYNTLLQWMDKEEIIVPPPSQFADKREEIQRLSLLSDEALRREVSSAEIYNNSMCNAQLGVLAKEVAVTGFETVLEAISPGGLQSFIHEQLEGFGDLQEKPERGVYRKRRLCRHFVKGFCLRGDSCDFLHDHSIFCSDQQKVFLGGLPLHFTPELLKTKLEQQGLTVLNKPRIMRGFTPKVCLGSVREAKELIAQRYIFLGDDRVDVRPYQDKDELRQAFPSVVKRSVFLGGFPENTTAEMIGNDLLRLDIKVVDCPVIKNGYAPRVVLETLEQTKMLIELKRVMINGTVVDVRPYVNFRKRY